MITVLFEFFPARCIPLFVFIFLFHSDQNLIGIWKKTFEFNPFRLCDFTWSSHTWTKHKCVECLIFRSFVRLSVRCACRSNSVAARDVLEDRPFRCGCWLQRSFGVIVGFKLNKLKKKKWKKKKQKKKQSLTAPLLSDWF